MKGDDGMTLIELMVATSLLLILTIAALNLLDSGTRAERAQQSRGDAIAQVRQAVERVAKDVRQATAMNVSSTQSRLDIETLVAGTPTRVIYDVADTDLRRTACTNFAFTSPCAGSPVTIGTRVSPAEVFCYDYDAQNGCLPSGTSPADPRSVSSVQIDVSLQPAVFSGGPIRAATNVKLRNL